MKKIARLMTALALMTYAFTSCEDIPAPYNTDGPQSDVIKVDPTGEGTKASPYNVSGIIDYTKDLANGASTAEVYVTGYVVNIREYQQQYNSLNYDIADDVEGKSEYFYVYGGKGLNKATFNSMADLPIGSKVTICGKVKNHNGVIEFDSQNYIVELDGKTSGGDSDAEAKGTGTLEDPFNAVAATKEAQKLESGAVSEKAYYIKGKVSKIATDKNGNILNFDQGTYGNASFYISDDGEAKNDFYCYRILYLGNKKWTSGAGDILKVGDDVIVCAKLTMYNSTPETQQNEGYLYSLNGKTEGAGGGGGDVTPGTPSGTGTEADPFNVAAAVAKCNEVGTTASTESYYIKGIADAEYTVSSYKNVEINIVDTEGSSEKFKVFRVKDKEGKGIKEGYKIAKGATIIVYGPVVNYMGNTPETATGSYLVSVNGQAPELDDGTSGGGGSSGSGGEGGGEAATSLTNGDFETWANSLPTGWKSASTASSATLEQSTDAHGGTYSCCVKGNESSNKRLASQEITLAAGTYVFSFWVKATTDDVAQARPGYVPVNDGTAGSYSYGDYANLTTSWQQVSYEFTLAAETTVCLVVMNPKKSNYSSGKDILVDDATLTKK